MPLDMTGIEELRAVVEYFNWCNEGFNFKYTAAQLIQLWKMARASDWDIFPDQWTERQIKAALRGKPPKWNADETPDED